MADQLSEGERAERVFFNLLVILTGVTLAFIATVLLELVRVAAPWSSIHELGLFVGWLGSALFGVLVFVSQALGSARTPIRPTTSVVLASMSLAVAQFVAVGLLSEFRDASASERVHAWLLVMSIASLIGGGFVTLVLRQIASPHYTETLASEAMLERVRDDRRAAVVIGSLGVVASVVMALIDNGSNAAWLLAVVFTAAILVPLVGQQEKMVAEVDI